MPPEMERAGGGGPAGGAAAGETAAAPNPVAAQGMVKGRSCKGCLFYSSVLRSRARGPVCAGITRSIPQVPDRMVGEIELEAIQEGHNLSNFKYACVGYSIYIDDKENPNGTVEKQARLPICVGVELLADRGTAKEAPAHLRKEALKGFTHFNNTAAIQAPGYKPGQRREDFLTKFQRNAGLVANGVARNLNKVGTYVKGTVDDILYPYRKRPK